MGTIDKRYLYEYDDPYILLAHHIIGTYRPADVLRCLTDNSYLRTLIIKEIRGQDFCGHFVDCIIENILEEKERMDYMNKLDELALYYYSKLDKGRLRDEILAALNKAGVNI